MVIVELKTPQWLSTLQLMSVSFKIILISNVFWFSPFCNSSFFSQLMTPLVRLWMQVTVTSEPSSTGRVLLGSMVTLKSGKESKRSKVIHFIHLQIRLKIWKNVLYEDQSAALSWSMCVSGINCTFYHAIFWITWVKGEWDRFN